ncbi:hypothetical protein [Litorimonas sp.]|uniref:hypothetical protein n=1 Tax=Litorimonas sp. TaxID=1892381 RepID=UPI003A87003D
MSGLPPGFRVIDEPEDRDSGLPEGFRLVENKASQEPSTRDNIANAARGIGAWLDTPVPGAKFMGQFAGDTIEDPVKTLVTDPAKAIRDVPKNTYNANRSAVKGLAQVARGDFGGARDNALSSLGSSLQATGGVAEGAGIFPAFKGAGKGASRLTGEMSKLLRGPSARQSGDPVANLLAAVAQKEGRSVSDMKTAAQNVLDNGATPDEMLFQSLNLPQTAQGLGNRGGASRDIFADAAKAQQKGQAGRVDNIIRNSLGSPDKDMTMDSIMARAREQSKPLYAAAMGENVKPNLGELAKVPAIRDYMAQAQSKMAGLNKADMTDMELLHQTQQMIGGKIGQTSRAGDNYESGLLSDMRNQVMDAGKAASPDYAAATATFRDGAELREAFEEGSKVFNDRTGTEFAARAQAMTPQQREAATAGVMRAVQTKLDNPETYGAIRAEFRRPSFRSNMQALVGPEKADEMVSQLERQAELAEMANNANYARNSKTAPTQQTIANVEDASRSQAGQALGRFGQFMANDGLSPSRLLSQGANKVNGVLSKVDDATLTEVSRILTMPADEGARLLLSMPMQERQAVEGLLAQAGQRGLAVVNSARNLPAMTGRQSLRLGAGAAAVNATNGSR